MTERTQDASAAAKPSPTEFERADQYAPGTRVVSKFTRRKGTVQPWPDGQPHPLGHGEVYGAVWVKWDDFAIEGHAWRHQINRI